MHTIFRIFGLVSRSAILTWRTAQRLLRMVALVAIVNALVFFLVLAILASLFGWLSGTVLTVGTIWILLTIVATIYFGGWPFSASLLWGTLRGNPTTGAPGPIRIVYGTLAVMIMMTLAFFLIPNLGYKWGLALLLLFSLNALAGQLAWHTIAQISRTTALAALALMFVIGILAKTGESIASTKSDTVLAKQPTRVRNLAKSFVRFANNEPVKIVLVDENVLAIPNGRGWVPTGIMVQKDDVVRCEISGRVPFTTMRVEPPSYKGDTTTGPMGTGLRPAQLREPIKADEQFLNNNEPIGTVLFRVGEKTRSYASEGTGEMKFKEDGQLYVGVNTRVGLSYNTGEFIGTCKVYRRS